MKHDSAGLTREIRLVFVSDVHLGALTLESDLRRMVELVNRQKP
jgi:hypothetical protein